MAPNKFSVKKESKRKIKVVSLADKLKILNLLKDRETVASVARKFGVYESTIRSIREKEKKIREIAATLGQYAAVNKKVRQNNMEKMEEMLMILLEDLARG